MEVDIEFVEAEENYYKAMKIVRQGTNYASIVQRLCQLISSRRILKFFIPMINLLFLKLEKRSSKDVLNYTVKAYK